MTPFALNPDQIARFRDDVTRLEGASTPIGLAVSGGPDSLALLLLAHAAFPGKIAAATVDHQLRPEAADEARHVARICESLGCPHAILTVTVANRGAGLQGDARAARYAALTEWAKASEIRTLATAHHADDQAETILMRLQRGAGIAGLSGIRPFRLDGALRIVRPLLGWTKAELVDLVARHGITAIDDPSNRDPRFDRARMRAFLAANPELEPARLTRSAAALREADEALDWASDAAWNRQAWQEGEAWLLDVTHLPRAIRRRLASRALSRLHADHALETSWQGSEDVEGLLTALEAGSKVTYSGVMASGGAIWRFEPAPPRKRKILVIHR
ncbi:tRNA lysidine(34) synthetase TilS [Allosphingosinicella vermicomposti]|uniref:tRNA lysidine(34) synthetase TilS n=1 Tax=Allosphingosinicella vermicomposti TaxID=614671 RepID=UPI000D110FD7|nr:tRNA lysidine(34) synthetase TilS [Allosphingosinicella vermicomposti]